MANITDPAAIAFSNNQIRPSADRYMSTYWWAKQLVADWTSKGLSSLFPNDSSVVVDGAATDGRTVITGADVNIIVSHVSALITDLEASSNLKRNQIQKVAVNETR